MHTHVSVFHVTSFDMIGIGDQHNSKKKSKGVGLIGANGVANRPNTYPAIKNPTVKNPANSTSASWAVGTNASQPACRRCGDMLRKG